MKPNIIFKNFKNFVFLKLILALSLLVFSCNTLNSFLQEVPKPSLSMENVSLQSLDLEGITFECEYSISNPYSLEFSIKEVATDVIFENQTLTKLKTDEGVCVGAKKKSYNKMLIKIPYDTIISFAQSASNKAKTQTSLPFSLNGNVTLDVSSIPLLMEDTFSIPFSKAFDVPIFKPSFSLSNPKFNIPSQETIKDSLKNAGVSVLKIPQMLTAFSSGNGLKDVLKQIDINFEFTFNLEVKNSGSAPWEFILDDCALQCEDGSLIYAVAKNSNILSSSQEKIPMSITLNSLTASEYIVQLITGKGSNPKFNFESKLTFTQTDYLKNIPLAYTREISLSDVKKF